jgi:hypothetical protein
MISLRERNRSVSRPGELITGDQEIRSFYFGLMKITNSWSPDLLYEFLVIS